ncbi:MAG: NAD(P)/FAD-dependent oxidoreductase [Pseudomonadota bacterium]|nr:NAD(P)/FAD-dependent oxidoreductase [Pseudomonadota bacterium]
MEESQEEKDDNQFFDVVIVGAGLSGIGAARQIVTKCPGTSLCILEGRQSLGGTWDLFRYPGIRSDSDMYTMGYDSKPWPKPKTIADGPSILDYIQEAASEKELDKLIRFDHKVNSASWNSNLNTWTLKVNHQSKILSFTTRFLYICSGYYDYDAGYRPRFESEEAFRGKIVHPQSWPSDLDYENKTVTVIGSGATAMTLVPNLAKKSKKVYMLQRSPTYVISLPSVDPLVKIINTLLPLKLAYSFNRWRYITLQRYIYNQTRTNPEKIKSKLLSLVHKNLDGYCDVSKHFTPSYNPWDQRLCLIPDGDLYKAIRKGKAEVVTEQIEKFYEKGVKLKSGETIESDIIVTATGLNLKLLGGIALEIDDEEVILPKSYTYKGLMFSGIPNLVYSIGYINASWTLRSEITAEFVCRILNQMHKLKAKKVVAHIPEDCILNNNQAFIGDFTPGYIVRGAHLMAKQGKKDPWRFNQNYALDKKLIRNGELEDGALQFIS